MNEPRRLYVLRHAKSSWDAPHLSDHDRPLAPRGTEAVRLLSEYVKQHDIAPELILCSSAVRTQQTLRGIYPDAAASIESELYGANEGVLMDRLRRVDPEVRTVMVIGHNPTLQMLVLKLTGAEARDRPSGAEGLSQIAEKLPTGALVTISFRTTWPELRPHQGVLIDYIRPKQLR